MASYVKTWKNFPVDLAKLDLYLRQNLSENYSGLSACAASCSFVFHASPNQQDVSLIDDYWLNIEEEVEAQSILDRTELPYAIRWKKPQLLALQWSDMTLMQRKLISNVELSDEEKQVLLSQFRAQV
jgi:hypothetical protein